MNAEAPRKSFFKEFLSDLKATRSFWLIMLGGVGLDAVDPRLGAVVGVAGLGLMVHDSELIKKGKL